jgi:hypothetical protein
MKIHALAIFLAVAICGTVFAELWIPLEMYVKRCVLIVKCKTEVKGDKVQYT